MKFVFSCRVDFIVQFFANYRSYYTWNSNGSSTVLQKGIIGQDFVRYNSYTVDHINVCNIYLKLLLYGEYLINVKCKKKTVSVCINEEEAVLSLVFN
jgi:hypothetical protein